MNPSELAQRCVAYPCTAERAEGSGFCPECKAKHERKCKRR